MTTSILPAPPIWSPPGLDDVLSFLFAFGDAFRARVTKSADEDRSDTVGPMDTAALSLGRSLLAARTEAELADLTAEALSKPWLPTFLALAFELFADRASKVDSLAADDNARALRSVDHPVARTMAQAHMHIGEVMKAVRTLYATLPEGRVARELRDAGARTLLRRDEGIAPMVADPAMPPQVSRLLLANFEGFVAMLGLYELVRRDGLAASLDHPLAGMLARQWVSGVRQYLRLLASFPETHVPEAVIPLDERLDLRAIQAAHDATRARWRTAPEQSRLALDALPELDDDA